MERMPYSGRGFYQTADFGLPGLRCRQKKVLFVYVQMERRDYVSIKLARGHFRCDATRHYAKTTS